MRVGVNEATGEWLTGWPHCVQSIGVILRTRVGSRPWFRDFGAAVKDLQDANAINAVLMEFARDIAEALLAYEPGFQLTDFELVDAGRDGVFAFELRGDFFPAGHLGDFSVKEERTVVMGANGGAVSAIEALPS